MVDVGGGKFLHPAAAASWDRMVAACRAATGGRLYIAGFQDAYRPYTRQVMFWARYRRGTGNLAARPGTSNHGWGLAVDVSYSSRAVQFWLGHNARKFGWGREPTEAWHWNFVGSLTVPASQTITKLEDDDVSFALIRTNGNPAEFAVFDGLTIREGLNVADAQRYKSYGDPRAALERGIPSSLYRGETGKEWDARLAATLADWRAIAKANLAAISSATGTPPTPVASDGAAIAQAVVGVLASKLAS
jgi:hypothetical protein